MASTSQKPLSHADYTVVCICPMGVELAPVEGMLDEIHSPLLTSRDQNAYTLGKIGGHNVVVAVLSDIGTNVAATVATQLLNDFPSIQFGLLVGIGGGVPGDEGNNDIRLGDVVVSQPTDTFGGVVQYDLGKKLTDGSYKRTGQLKKPPSVLSANVRKLQAQHSRVGNQLSRYLSEMTQRYPKMQSQYSFPATDLDQLFFASYAHQPGVTCDKCDRQQTVSRLPRSDSEPQVHYGTIGSANLVIKDAVVRDELKRDMKILCVEMEAAGLMDNFPCLVIQGICDYADSHKNKRWQPYAAAVASAYIKELLMVIPAPHVAQTPNAVESVTSREFSSPNIEVEEGETMFKSELPYMSEILGELGQECPDTLTNIGENADSDSESCSSSIVSLIESSSSQTSQFSNQEQQTAIQELETLLNNDEVLKSLYNTAIKSQKIGGNRFERNYGRLLKELGSELMEEAGQNDQKVAGRFIVSRASQIARGIRIVNSPQNDAKFQQMHDLRKQRAREAKQSRTQAFAEEQSATRAQPPILDDSQDSEDSRSEDDIRKADEMPHLHAKLEAFIKRSKAFEYFRARVRRFIYPDQLTWIRSELMSDIGSFGRHKITFTLHWNLLEFCETELDGSKDLARVLTISGSGKRAFAATCEDYINTFWPQNGRRVIDSLQSALNDSQQVPSLISLSEIAIDFRQATGTNQDTIIIQASGASSELLELAHQLAWLSSVFRVPQPGKLSVSEIHFRRSGPLTFELYPVCLQPIPTREQACWHSLFENTVIAQGFPTPQRNTEKGIEISFQLMTRLAGTLYTVSYKNGTYLKGFSTLLFPTARTKASIQWHLDTSLNGDPYVPVGQILKHDWVKINDLKLLATARTFLGAYKNIIVNLATENSCYQGVEYSGADDESPTTIFSPDTAQIGTSGMGIFGFNITNKIRLPKGLSHTSHQDTYERMLDTAKGLPILLYDNHPASRRGWLVPTLCAMLHMAHVWARDKTDLLMGMPYAEAKSNAGAAVWDLLVNRKESKRQLRKSVNNKKGYYVHNLIMSFWKELEQKREKEALRRAEDGLDFKFEKDKLYGWEIMDIVNGEPDASRKQIALSEDLSAWSALSKNVLVLLCQNLGDVILPAPGTQVCDDWKSVPIQSDYLTATIRCLRYLARQRQSEKSCLRITNDAYWLPDRGLFDDCHDNCINRRCSKLPQELVKSVKGIMRGSDPPSDGAAIFGARSLPKCGRQSQQTSGNRQEMTTRPLQTLYSTTRPNQPLADIRSTVFRSDEPRVNLYSLPNVPIEMVDMGADNMGQ